MGALLFYLKLPMVNCIVALSLMLGPIDFGPEVGGAPVEPNADGDVAGGEPSTVGGGRQLNLLQF